MSSPICQLYDPTSLAAPLMFPVCALFSEICQDCQCSIKNTVRKSISGPHQLKMDDEELLTWIHLVINKLNNRPLILGAPLGITLTPNYVPLGFRDS